MKRHHSRPSLTLERGLHLLTALRPPPPQAPLSPYGSTSPRSGSVSGSSLPPSPDPNTATFSFPSLSSLSRPGTPSTFSPSWSPKLYSIGTWATAASGSVGPRTPLLPAYSPRQPPAQSPPGRGLKTRRAALLWLVGIAVLLWLCWIGFPRWRARGAEGGFASSARAAWDGLGLGPWGASPSYVIHPAAWPPPTPPSPNARYLTYHPHSGLHNQLLALQNALLLAALLNRTLLIPELRLGRAVSYSASAGGGLARALGEGARGGLGHCAAFAGAYAAGGGEDGGQVPEECDGYFDYASVPFAALFALPPQEVVRSVQLPGPVLTPEHLAALSLELNTSSPSSKPPSISIYNLTDTSPYQYKFYETATLARPLGRYAQRIDLDTLAHLTRHTTVLSLGSLFGSARIKLSPASKSLRHAIRSATVPAHPAVLAAAARVVRALGGRDSFVAAHVRLGDGEFERDGVGRVRDVWWALVRALGADERAAGAVERWAHAPASGAGNSSFSSSPQIDTDIDLADPPAPPAPDPAALRTPHPPLAPFPVPAPRPPRPLVCPRPLHTDPARGALNTPLFVATPDIGHPVLRPLVRAFPCVFSLGDGALRGLADVGGKVVEGRGGVDLAPWLAGIVDALVASEGRAVVGTRGSTFSAWVADVGWRRAHGWEVVDRG